jgi:hypothetical protein
LLILVLLIELPVLLLLLAILAAVILLLARLLRLVAVLTLLPTILILLPCLILALLLPRLVRLSKLLALPFLRAVLSPKSRRQRLFACSQSHRNLVFAAFTNDRELSRVARFLVLDQGDELLSRADSSTFDFENRVAGTDACLRGGALRNDGHDANAHAAALNHGHADRRLAVAVTKASAILPPVLPLVLPLAPPALLIVAAVKEPTPAVILPILPRLCILVLILLRVRIVLR